MRPVTLTIIIELRFYDIGLQQIIAFVLTLNVIRRKSTGVVSVLGEIEQKITVNATDDSYDATKKRIEIYKELEKTTRLVESVHIKKAKYGEHIIKLGVATMR